MNAEQKRSALRIDLKLIADMVEPSSRLLDVGCGDERRRDSGRLGGTCPRDAPPRAGRAQAERERRGLGRTEEDEDNRERAHR